MQLLRSRTAWLTCLVLVAVVRPVYADPPPDPLRLIPAQADALVKIEDARHLVESAYGIDALKELQKFDAVKEYYNSTSVKRFNQLIAFFETKLGAKKFELLDKVAGGGLAIGIKIEKQPKVVLVIQGKDEQTTGEFVTLALEILQQELDRQGKKAALTKGKFEGIETCNLGPEFHLARVGAAVVVANHADALKASLKLHLNQGGKSILTNDNHKRARHMLPKQVLAWGWLNMEPVRSSPESKLFFEEATKMSQTNATFLGGMVDVAARSPFVCFGLSQKGSEFRLSVQFPEGTKGMSERVLAWFPSGKGGALPLLEPPNVLSSTSYYLDLAEFWKNRKNALLPQEVEGLEKADEQSGKVLAGIKMSELFLASGAHQRFVATQPTSSIYKRKPKTAVPSFALVHEMRDEALGKKLDRVIRIGAVLLTTQFNLELQEEDHNGVHIVTYKFPEDKELKGDQQDIRFGFSPSYAWVNNQFIGSSTLELCRTLIDELKKEKKSKELPVMFQSKLYSAGAASFLKSTEKQVLAQFVLGQGISLDKARQEYGTLLQMLEGLGTAEIETAYTADRLKINLKLNLGK